MKKKTPEQASSQRELARLVGRDVAAVNRWIHGGKWPFGKTGPWDVAKVRAWARTTLTPSEPSSSGSVTELGPERRMKLAKTAEQVAALKLAREIKQGAYHRTEECKARLFRQVLGIKEAFLHTLPLQVATRAGAELVALYPSGGLDLDRVRHIIERAVYDYALGICNEFGRDNGDARAEYTRRGLERQATEGPGE